jgi:hypothetical protein
MEKNGDVAPNTRGWVRRRAPLYEPYPESADWRGVENGVRDTGVAYLTGWLVGIRPSPAG